MAGRPLVLTDEAPILPLAQGWRTLRYMRPAQLDEAVDAINDSHGPPGVHIYTDDLNSLWDLFRSRFKFVLAAGGVVVDEGGRLLAIRRLGKWDLPKGKVDPGEAIDAAALREVREECGVAHLELLRPIAQTWHTYERKGRDHLKRTDWFLMRGSSADKLVPQLDEDIEEVTWLDRAGVQRMKADTYPSLLPVINAWEALG